jgi:hypothetical protein
MAYPPTVPPSTRANETPQADNHPSDHNAISRALSDIVNVLGLVPAGQAASVDARVFAVEQRLGVIEPILPTKLKAQGTGLGSRFGSGNVQLNGFGDAIINFSTPFKAGTTPTVVLTNGWGGAGSDVMVLSINSTIGISSNGFAVHAFNTTTHLAAGAVLLNVQWVAMGEEP